MAKRILEVNNFMFPSTLTREVQAVRGVDFYLDKGNTRNSW